MDRLQHRNPKEALNAFMLAEKAGLPPLDSAIAQSAALIELKEWNRTDAILKAALKHAPKDARIYNE